jgi:hypothetical protein
MTPAVELWLAVGKITGDQSREDAYHRAAAQLALVAAVKGNDLAREAVGQLDKIESVDSQVRAALPNDLAALAGADELPEDGIPESVADLYSLLRPIRAAADAGLIGGAA